MTGFKNILVPTDYGEPAAHALELATMLASRFESKLTLLHAFYVPPIAYANGMYLPMDAMMRDAEKMLAQTLDRVKQENPRAEAVFVSGVPWEQILHVVHERGCDLIVMGTHGRRGLARAFLGSVAERVVRMSPVAVLTVGARVETEPKR